MEVDMKKTTKKDENFLEYILKENFNLVLIFCSLFTIYILLSISFVDFNSNFISNITVILIIFFILTIAGIWVQKKHSQQTFYYKILIGAFYFSTVIAIMISDISMISSYLFIFSGLLLLLIFTSYLYTPRFLFVPFAIIVIGINIILTLGMHQNKLYIVVSLIILLFSLFISSQRSQKVKETYSNKIQIMQMKEMLEQLSFKDILTGLYNNHYIDQQLEYEINRSNRYKTPLCLIIMDIDQFEVYNSNHGQLAGDDALTIIGNILTTNTRTTDILGRYSGEEFIILLPNTSLDETILLAERLRILIHENDFGYSSKISVSVGIKELSNESKNQFIKSTIDNVQLAKKIGSNTIYYDNLGG